MRHGPTTRLLGALAAALLSRSVAAYDPTNTPHLVASVAAASNDFWLAGISSYHFSTAEVSTAVLPADAPDRYVYFGSPLSITFTGAVAGARYWIDASFASDNARVETVSLNGSQLGASFALPAQSATNFDWDCGTATTGTFTLSFARVSGANAVVSSLRIHSSDPTPLAPPPTNVASTVPRLSPWPAAVAGVAAPVLDLGGTWQFRTSAPAGFPTNDLGAWSPIDVPGEWVMQGFTVASGTNAAYRRSFVLPADWTGSRVKLRFDAVYSSCQVWVNDQAVGSHLGGFTPFELDVTAALQAGTNWLELAVVNESLADTLASGTQYAVHQLGGITRKVTLLALPPLQAASLHVLPQVATNLAVASAEVRLSVSETPQGYRLAVEDDGPGIPEAQRDQVFSRGARLDEQRVGHGLGLGIVRDIVEVWGGVLQLQESELGGLKVLIQLPRR